MEVLEKPIKVFQTSKMDNLKPILIWGVVAIILGAIFTSAGVVIFGIIFLVIILALCMLAGSVKVIIDSEKESVTIEKIDFLGNLVETKNYLLSRYHFKIISRRAYKGGRNYFFAFRDTNYKGGELYYNEDFYTDEYNTGSFSKSRAKLIENTIQKIQDKKGLA